MSSVQERLQLKRVPLDKWSIKEQLCLASAVACSGDQNWMSVSRSLKMLCPSNRPSDWFSQKSCAAQYGKLLENVETPKRKKRTVSDRDGATAVETPSELILRKLTQERMAELKKILIDEQQQYQKLKDEVALVQTADETKLREMWAQIEAENKLKEKERQSHAMWLKEREEKKLEMERAWRPLLAVNTGGNQNAGSPKTSISLKIKSEDSMDIDDPSSSSSSSKPGTSPLLTSLLKSPSPAPNQSQTNLIHTINTPSNAVRNLAPTITNLLTSNTSSEPGQQTSVSNTKTINTQQSQSKQQFMSGNLGVTTSSTSTVSTVDSNLSTDNLLSKGADDLLAFADLTGDSQSPTGDDNDLNKDEDQQLMDVFNELISDNIDELTDILTDNNAIILSPDILEEESILENVDSLIADQEELEKAATLMGESETVGSSLSKNEVAHTKDIESVVKTDEPTRKLEENVEHSSKNDDGNDVDDAPKSLDSNKTETRKNDHQTSSSIQKSSTSLSMANEVNSHVVSTKLEEVKPEPEEINLNGEKVKDVSTAIKIDNSASKMESPEVQNENQLSNDSAAEIKLKIKEEKLENYENPEVIEILDDTSKGQSPVKIEINDDDDKMDVEIIDDSLTVSNIRDVINTSTTKAEDEVTVKSEMNETEMTSSTVRPITLGDDAHREENSRDDEDDDNKAISDIANKIKEDDQKDSDVEIIKSNQSSVEQKIESEDEVYEDVRETIVKGDDPLPVSAGGGNVGGVNDELPSISLIDTDDDSPIEVIKEDRVGKTKRDYSRKKADSSEPTTPTSNKKQTDEPIVIDEKSNLSARMKLKERERSESPSMDEDTEELPRTRRRYSSTQNIDSVPNSPASSSEDREHKAWRKNILVVYNRLSAHKYSSIFNKFDEIYPHYKAAVHRPMDLLTIKKNLDGGVTKTTAEFQRDIMLMCHNLMMLSSRSDTNSNYNIAKDFLNDAVSHIETTIEGWKKDEKSVKPSRGRKSSRMSNV